MNIIVQPSRFACGTRKTAKFTEVVGIENHTVQLQDIFTYERKGIGTDGKVVGEFEATDFVPVFNEQLVEIGMAVDASTFSKNRMQAA